ncbi:hypothetical protein Unana1_08517 [Umbelopsis nana]
MEIPLNIVHSNLHQSQVESIEYRINSVMKDLGFCSTAGWYGGEDQDDEDIIFAPISLPWSPNVNNHGSGRTMPTGEEFLKLLKLSNRLPYTQPYGSERKVMPLCQTVALEEFFDPLTSNYCDQRYHYLQLQDTLIEIFSTRRVGCYQLNIGNQEISYIMGYWTPNTKNCSTGWLIGLKAGRILME